ncbi:hypothetical protein JW977_03490 [Candidatus Falkowbacteria bacterium]|nr:hypothetical protein [Candidatus Falkowbacteria bacterium]
MEIKNIYTKIKELIERNQFVLYLVIFIIVLFTYLWVQSSPTFLDPDSYYHLKISRLIYENRGPIINFPWLQFTVLKNYYIDHHFLYHVLAVPFILLFGDFPGFKFFTVILATAFVLLSYTFFKRYKLIYPEIFILTLLFAPALLFRISLAKASAFSLLILFFGIYCLFKRYYYLLFLLSFFYVWSYGGFLLILGVTGIYVLSEAVNKMIKRNLAKSYNHNLIFLFKHIFNIENLKLVFASATGIICGLIINPYFPKNLLFYWQQIVQIGLVNYRKVVNVGGEWYPYNISNLLPDSGVIIIFAALALVLFFIFHKKQKTESIFFLILSILFFILTLKSKRYVEYFIPFLVYFSAFSLTHSLQGINIAEYFKKIKKESARLGKIIFITIIYLAIIIPTIFIKDIIEIHKSFEGGIKFTRFSGIATYLKNNSAKGDIIMHTSWDDFPMLFYQNDKNYYIVGLDPTFMYKYNPNLYESYADITMAKKSDNLYQEIKNNFRASYFIVNKGRDQLERNLILDDNFSKVYEDNDAKIFKLK